MGLFKAIKKIGKGVVDGVSSAVKGVAKGVADVVTGVGEGIYNVGKGVVEGVASVGKGIGMFAYHTLAGDGLITGLEELGKGIGGGVVKPIEGVGKGIGSVVEGVAGGIWNPIKGVGQGAVQIGQGVIEGVGGEFLGIDALRDLGGGGDGGNPAQANGNPLMDNYYNDPMVRMLILQQLAAQQNQNPFGGLDVGGAGSLGSVNGNFNPFGQAVGTPSRIPASSLYFQTMINPYLSTFSG